MKIVLDGPLSATESARVSHVAQYQASARQLERAAKAAAKRHDWATLRALGEQLRALTSATITG